MLWQLSRPTAALHMTEVSRSFRLSVSRSTGLPLADARLSLSLSGRQAETPGDSAAGLTQVSPSLSLSPVRY